GQPVRYVRVPVRYGRVPVGGNVPYGATCGNGTGMVADLRKLPVYLWVHSPTVTVRGLAIHRVTTAGQPDRYAPRLSRAASTLSRAGTTASERPHSAIAGIAYAHRTRYG